MPFKLGPTYLTREDLDREREELQATWRKWERRERTERALGGERSWPVGLWRWLEDAFTLPPKPPADPRP